MTSPFTVSESERARVHLYDEIRSLVPPEKSDDTTPPKGRIARGFGAPLTRSRRILDVLVASVALVALQPVFLLIALLIRFGSPGPVFFRQQRRGYRQRLFCVLKFRTMVVDAEQRLEELEKNNESAGSELFKLRDDPRVTRLGRFLRRSSLDELPQLINVLRGEMSLVGPRPLQLPDSDKLQHVDPEKYYRRLEVKPGITGLWQVASRYELSNWQSMLEVDDHYLTNWSLWLDLRILWKTTLISFLGVEGRNRLPVTPANLANREKNEGVRTPQKESSKPALALRPRNPTRTDQEQRRFEKLIDFGSTIYPLRRPLRGIARLSPDGQRTFTVPDLEPHFIGRGLTLDDACFDWLQAVHIAFQSLFGKLPFEMTGEEYSRWIILSNVIDVDAYEATRPLVLRQIGHVLSAGPGPWIVAWADRTESVALAEMPAEFAALHQGDWFAAIVQRDRTSDHLVAVRQIKPIPPLEPLSNERLSLFWDALPTTASLPVSSSDWTRR